VARAVRRRERPAEAGITGTTLTRPGWGKLEA
jgi:hypothetical protein